MTGFGRSSSRALKNSTVPSREAIATAKQSKTSKSSKTSKQKAVADTAVPAAVDLDVSVKSVNGRFLELRFHLPREYAEFEREFKDSLMQTFRRGTVDIHINRSKTGAAPKVKLNSGLARAWAEAYGELARELKIKSQPQLDLLSRVPELFRVESESEISDEEKAMALRLLKDAAEACDSERRREGQALAAELSTLCRRLEELMAEVERVKGEAAVELEGRLRSRLDEKLQDYLRKPESEARFDETRIAQEIVIYLDRADVTEEIVRLREHLKFYLGLLGGHDSQGKKLDFYAQELLREVNTIGSKSQIAKLTSLVVESKTVVERIREQVQNVE